MDVDFEGSDTGDGKSDHVTPAQTPSPSPEPSDLGIREQVYTPTPSTSPSPEPHARSNFFPRPPVPLPPPGSGKRLGYLLGVRPSSSKAQGGGSKTSAPPQLQPAGVVAGARAKRRPSPLSGTSASDAKNSNKVNSNKAKGKAQCVRSCNSQALEDGPSESVNEDEDRVVISDEDEDDVKDITPAAKRRLTSKVWKEMKKKNIRGEWKAICNYCHKQLSATSKSGTTHLKEHLKTCTQKMLKTKGGKTLNQAALRMNAQEDGKVSVENYIFYQEVAREELGNMLVLHEYPLSIVDHGGFRRFVGALQPLFKLYTRNTIRKDIIGRYNSEKKKAIEYMNMVQSRVAITTDMWTADNQKKGYMAVTSHFIDVLSRLA